MTTDVKTMLISELCKGYEIDQDEGVIIVKTPLRYDDGDHVVVFITPQQDEAFIIDDNGDAATRLMFEGVDIDSQLVQTWLKNTLAIYHIEWDAERDRLWCKTHPQALIERVICMAQVSVQMQTLTAVVLKAEEQEEQIKSLSLLLSLTLHQQKDNNNIKLQNIHYSLNLLPDVRLLSLGDTHKKCLGLSKY
ncbi:MAG: DUF1828 domain-containing protein [Pseudomonadota bacterium]